MTPAESAASAVDSDELVRLVQDATRIPSITPNEHEFAAWVLRQLKDFGWDQTKSTDIGDGRPNVHADVGSNAGPSLLLAGHLDTVHVDDWIKHWKDTDRADPFAAEIVDGEIWGRGVADQKAGICSIIAAVRAIHRAGSRPKGMVSALFVSDEESGQPGSGVSAGMRAAVQNYAGHGPKADFLIYTEPTTSAVYTAQMGFFIAEITLTGKSAYFGRPELGVDALRAGHELLTALWTHSEELRTIEAHELIGYANLLVTEVRSGGNIAVPGLFNLSLIRKILPSENMDEAADRIREITARVGSEHGVEVEVVFSAPRDHAVGGTPDEIPSDHPGVVSLARSISTITGEEARIEAAPFWSEKPFLAALDVPGVYFAPGDISTCHTPFERLEIKELLSATRILTHFVASWCGLEELPTPPVKGGAT